MVEMSPTLIEESQREARTVLESTNQGDDISAPSMQSVPRERKRPLRTYGKRSAQSRDADTPPPKKRKLKEEAKPEAALPKITPPPPGTTQKEPPKRGSIISYFRPVPPTSSAPPSPPPPAPSAERLTPPISSPITFSKARKRRLTTRPRIDEDGGTCTRTRWSEEQDGQEYGEDSRNGDPIDGDQRSASPSRSDAGAGQQSAMAEITPGTLNRSSSVTTDGGGKKPKLGKRQTREKVQMTLSLAINPGPGFTICKDCGVLYNPLNEKDRKEHKKQHAAHVRAKLKVQAKGSTE